MIFNAENKMVPSEKAVLLLVEDSDDDIYFFSRTFEKSGAGCLIRHVPNGAKAIEYLQASQAGSESLPRMIFLDLKMPVMNGFDVLTWIQSADFNPSIPVVVLSGSEQQNDKDRAKKLGAAGYLVKPVKPADLTHFLSSICPDARTASTSGAGGGC